MVSVFNDRREPSIAEKFEKGKEKQYSKSSKSLELAEEQVIPFSKIEPTTPLPGIKASVVPTTLQNRDRERATENRNISPTKMDAAILAITAGAKLPMDGASKTEKQIPILEVIPSDFSAPVNPQIPRAKADDSIPVRIPNETEMHKSSSLNPEATNTKFILIRDETPDFEPPNVQRHSSPTVVQHQSPERESEALGPRKVSMNTPNTEPSAEWPAPYSLPVSPHRNGLISSNIQLQDPADESSERPPEIPKTDTKALKNGTATFRDVPLPQSMLSIPAKDISMNASPKSSPTSTSPQITFPILKGPPDKMEEGIPYSRSGQIASVKLSKEALDEPSFILHQMPNPNLNKESKTNLEPPTLTPITSATSNVSSRKKSLAFESPDWITRALSKVAINDKNHVDSSLEYPGNYQDNYNTRSGALTTKVSVASESETTSYVSLGSESRRKRDMVYESLKRLARRDFMTQDDVENMFSGPGCFITAFVVKGGKHHQIPYDGQFSLRKSHIKNLHASKWWKDFAFLTTEEISSLTEIVADGEDYFKTLVRLQWLQKERFRFWSSNQGVLVAIVKNEPLAAAEDETTSQSTGNGIERRRRMSAPRRELLQDRTKIESSSLSDKVSVLNNLISPGALEDEEAPKEFIIYTAYTIRVFEPHSLYGDPTSFEPSITKEGFSEADILQRISQLNDQGPQLIQKKLNLLNIQQEQIARLFQEISETEINTGFAWHLAQIDNIGNSSQGLRSITVYLRKTPTTVKRESDAEVYRQSGQVSLTSIPDQVSVVSPPEEAPEVVRPRQNVTFRKQNSEIKSRRPPPPNRYHDSDSSDDGLQLDSDESNTSLTNSSAKTRTRSTKKRRTSTRKTTYNRSPGSRLPPRPESTLVPEQAYHPFPSTGPSYDFSSAPVQPYAPYGYPMAPPPGLPSYAPPFSSHGIDYDRLRSPHYPYYDHPPQRTIPLAPPPSVPRAPPKSGSRRESSMKDEQDRATSVKEDYAPKLRESISIRPRGGTTAASERPLADRFSVPSRHALTAESAFSAKDSSKYSGRRQSYYGEPSHHSSSGYPAGLSAPPSQYAPSQYAASQYAPSSAPAFPLRRVQLPYPEYYDGRSFNPRAPIEPDELDGDADIVQKLLMDWTPAGEEQKAQNTKDSMNVTPDSAAVRSTVGSRHKKAAAKAKWAARDDDIEDNGERNTAADKQTNDSDGWGSWGAAKPKKKGKNASIAEGSSKVLRPAYVVEVDDSGKRRNKTREKLDLSFDTSDKPSTSGLGV